MDFWDGVVMRGLYTCCFEVMRGVWGCLLLLLPLAHAWMGRSQERLGITAFEFWYRTDVSHFEGCYVHGKYDLHLTHLQHDSSLFT